MLVSGAREVTLFPVLTTGPWRLNTERALTELRLKLNLVCAAHANIRPLLFGDEMKGLHVVQADRR